MKTQIPLKAACIAVTLFIFSCSKTEEISPEPTHWDYENTDWISEGYSECAGTIQSPVDIITANTIKADLPNLSFSYSSFPMKIVDNGHTLQVLNNGTNSVSYNGKKYDFKQFHYHYHSEHKLDGVASEMEVHLVHQEPTSGALLVVGFFMTSGANNLFFDSILNNWPSEKEKEVTTTTSIDMNTILPTDRKYYTYIGSLTTPPCSQGVSFFLFKQKMEVSSTQLDKFKAKYDHNARAAQPLNARLVYEDIL
jgi:carbonic anhydrase